MNCGNHIYTKISLIAGFDLAKCLRLTAAEGYSDNHAGGEKTRIKIRQIFKKLITLTSLIGS